MAEDSSAQHPFYIGITGGAGSTTWDGLVPAKRNQSVALSFSTPIKADEGGAVWGAFAGFELSPYFAIEGSYTKYPDATLTFDPTSLFTFENNERLGFTSETMTLSLMAKLMIFIPHTSTRLYSSIGVASLNRKDLLVDDWMLTPTFGIGLNHNFTPHIMGELGGNFTAGYGESHLNPALLYYPFLYAGFIRLAYRF